jgi:hypothetical protein
MSQTKLFIAELCLIFIVGVNATITQISYDKLTRKIQEQKQIIGFLDTEVQRVSYNNYKILRGVDKLTEIKEYRKYPDGGYYKELEKNPNNPWFKDKE